MKGKGIATFSLSMLISCVHVCSATLNLFCYIDFVEWSGEAGIICCQQCPTKRTRQSNRALTFCYKLDWLNCQCSIYPDQHCHRPFCLKNQDALNLFFIENVCFILAATSMTSRQLFQVSTKISSVFLIRNPTSPRQIP